MGGKASKSKNKNHNKKDKEHFDSPSTIKTTQRSQSLSNIAMIGGAPKQKQLRTMDDSIRPGGLMLSKNSTLTKPNSIKVPPSTISTTRLEVGAPKEQHLRTSLSRTLDSTRPNSFTLNKNSTVTKPDSILNTTSKMVCKKPLPALPLSTKETILTSETKPNLPSKSALGNKTILSGNSKQILTEKPKDLGGLKQSKNDKPILIIEPLSANCSGDQQLKNEESLPPNQQIGTKKVTAIVESKSESIDKADLHSSDPLTILNSESNSLTVTSNEDVSNKSPTTNSQINIVVLRLEDLKDFMNNILVKIVEKAQVHLGIFCDNCGEWDFRDFRYKCLVCQNYDLCGRCFERRYYNKTHDTSHPVLLIDVPLTPEKKQEFS